MKKRDSKTKGKIVDVSRGPALSDEDFKGSWFECVPKDPGPPTNGARNHSRVDIESAAKVAMDEACEAYAQRLGKNGQKQFRRTMAKAGTVMDRVAALTLVVQESPIHHLNELRELINLAPKTMKYTKRSALEALKDLFIHDLLPPSRKLVSLEMCKDLHPNSLKRVLVYAWFESELKKLFSIFVDHLKSFMSHSVVHHRLHSMKVAVSLLMERPEQEERLLELIINKMGDPERKIASSASHLLTILLKEHSAMKSVVVTEVLQFLHRTGLNDRTKHYAVSYLAQLRFTSNDRLLARKMIESYLSLFEDALLISDGDPAKKEQSHKLVAAILTGCNRAFPFAESETWNSIDSKFDGLFKVAHSSSLAAAVQALTLLFQVSRSRSNVSDRFYRALYERFSRSDIPTSTKQGSVLRLVYQSVSADEHEPRAMAFCKRLLQSATQSSPSFAAGCLRVLWEIIARRRKQPFRRAVAETKGAEFTRKSVSRNDSDPYATNEELENYKIDHRDPAFANAHRSSFWELVALSRHFHPSVSHFCRDILNLTRIKYDGDPIKDFGVLAFLERLNFEKPKRRILEDLKNRKVDTGRPAVNSQFFAELVQSGNIRDDELFYARIFDDPTKTRSHGKSKSKEDHDDEAEFDSAFEKEMEKIMEMDRFDEDSDTEEPIDHGLIDVDSSDVEKEEDIDDEVMMDDVNHDASDIDKGDFGDSSDPSERELESEHQRDHKPKKRKRSRVMDDDELPSFAPMEDYAHLIANEESIRKRRRS